MAIRSLAEVGVRLEEAVKALPGDGQDLYDLYESVAIQILDSEFADFPPDVLHQYLEAYLRVRQLELTH